MKCECCDYEWTPAEQQAREEAECLMRYGYSAAYIEATLYCKYNSRLSLQDIAKMVKDLEGKNEHKR